MHKTRSFIEIETECDIKHLDSVISTIDSIILHFKRIKKWELEKYKNSIKSNYIELSNTRNPSDWVSFYSDYLIFEDKAPSIHTLEKTLNLIQIKEVIEKVEEIFKYENKCVFFAQNLNFKKSRRKLKDGI